MTAWKFFLLGLLFFVASTLIASGLGKDFSVWWIKLIIVVVFIVSFLLMLGAAAASIMGF